MNTPNIFYYWVAIGLLCFLLKKFIAAEGWHLLGFLKSELGGIINSVAITVATAYLLPDAVIAASDLHAVADFAAKHPSLVEKITVVAGGTLGFTGGSIAFDLIPMLYNLPLIGPFLKKIVERRRSAKADRMAEAHGIDPQNP